MASSNRVSDFRSTADARRPHLRALSNSSEKRGSKKRTPKQARVSPAHKARVRKMASCFLSHSVAFRTLRRCFPSFAHVQATAAWQWRNFWAARAPAGRSVVHINMDETCVRLGLRPSALTLVAFIADNDEAQALLPQVILGSSRVLPQRVAAQHIRRDDNIFVVSGKTAWLSARVLCRILRLVGVALRAVQERFWLLLSMDVCPVHLSLAVAAAARRAGFCLHYIPASMTSSLQPLDTHVFAQLKLRLSQAHHDLLLQSRSGTVKIDEFVSLVCCMTRRLFTHAWPVAFQHCGFSAAQCGLGASLLRALETCLARAGADFSAQCRRRAARCCAGSMGG